MSALGAARGAPGLGARALGSGAIGIAAVLHGVVTGRWIGSLVAVVAALVAALVPRRGSLPALGQRLLTVLAAAGGGALGWLESPESPVPLALARVWSSLAVAALFAAVFRLWVRAPEEARQPARAFFATAMIALAAVVAAGETRSGPVYPIFAGAFLLASLAGMRAHDEGRAPLRELPARSWVLVLAVLGLAGATALGVALVLPPVAGWSRDKLIASLGDVRTGLGERMVLGSLEGMLQSDEIVGRVYGAPADYLRGAVYDHYQAGQWAVSTTEGTRTVTLRGDAGAGGDGAVRVVLTGEARGDRYLVPLGASAVSAPDAAVLVDRFAVVRVPRGAPSEVAFALSGPAEVVPSEPTPDDLRMPVRMARAMAPIVKEWTAGADTAEAKVEAIAGRLRRDYRYSLGYARGGGDPLLDFLRDNPQGHCEYFASAMAMLARASGVPARVVAGYRVAERNELGGYWVIRERNAHAWVEVYLPGKGWQTVDATPEDLLPQNQPHSAGLLGAAWDLVRTRAAAAMNEAADALTIWHVVGALLAAIGALLVARWWGQRGLAAEGAASAFWQVEAPPAAFTRLVDALAQTGFARSKAEPIERLAARLEGDRVAGARELLLRYAALRYGGVGDGAALFAEMEREGERLRAAGGEPAP